MERGQRMARGYPEINILVVPGGSYWVIEIEGQRGKVVGLKPYLGVWQPLPTRNLSHQECAMPHSSFCWGSNISVDPRKMYKYWIFWEVEKNTSSTFLKEFLKDLIMHNLMTFTESTV